MLHTFDLQATTSIQIIQKIREYYSDVFDPTVLVCQQYAKYQHQSNERSSMQTYPVQYN